jgi:hypothetical protein
MDDAPSTGRSHRLWGRGGTPLDHLARLHAVSTAADACIAVSLTGSLFFSASVDAARPRLALYLLLTLAPFAVVAPIIGPVTDRFGSAQPVFLAFTCQARAVLALFIAIDLQSLLLYPESFGVLVLGKAYAIVKRSLIPTLVPDEQLVAANARFSRIGSISGAVGGAVAVGVLTLSDATAVLRLAAVVHLVAAAIALRVPRSRATAAASEADLSRSTRTDVPSTVRRALLALTALRAAAGLATFVVAFALKRTGAPSVLFGVVALAATAASLAGTVVSPVLRRAARDERVPLATCGAVAVLGGMFAALLDGRAGMLLAITTVAIAGSIGRHFFDSVLQRDLADAARRRAFARAESVMQLAWVVGAFIPTWLNVDSRQGYILVASTAVFAVAAMLSERKRTVDALPRDPHDTHLGAPATG